METPSLVKAKWSAILMAATFLLLFNIPSKGSVLVYCILLYATAHIATQIYLGRAASQSGRSWVYYGLLPILWPLIGVVISYFVLSRKIKNDDGAIEHEANKPVVFPQTNIDTEKAGWKPSVLFWFVAMSASFLAFSLGLLALFVVPAFEELYVSFGANNPAPTELLLQIRNWLWLASVVTIGIWLFWWISKSRYQFRNRILAGFMALGATSLGILVFAIWALYLPISQLSVAP